MVPKITALGFAWGSRSKVRKPRPKQWVRETLNFRIYSNLLSMSEYSRIFSNILDYSRIFGNLENFREYSRIWENIREWWWVLEDIRNSRKSMAIRIRRSSYVVFIWKTPLFDIILVGSTVCTKYHQDCCHGLYVMGLGGWVCSPACGRAHSMWCIDPNPKP